ncbi:MAG: XRE family transcriptional regulator, partial [Clostridia bacterium]
KQLRLQRGLTQEELAQRCELTKGYISQLENDIASPSIATLIDILNILGITPSAFFKTDSEEKVVFTQTDYFESEGDEQKKIWLIPNSQKNEMEPIILVLKEGAESEVRYPVEGEEFGFVLDGKIRIETETTVYKAKKGDAFYIDGKRQHKIVNANKGNSKIIWVTTPSNF